MAAFETFLKKLVKDVQIELTQEFDRNFERKAFFDNKWPQTKWPNTQGSLMMRNGNLRRSIKSQINGSTISWSSHRKDAALHNQGGTITVTAKMKRFFWAMYYKARNALTYSVKKKAPTNTKRNRKLTATAAIWKNLALMKTGSKIKIPQRQFIGHHPKQNPIITQLANKNAALLEKDLFNQLKNRK